MIKGTKLEEIDNERDRRNREEHNIELLRDNSEMSLLLTRMLHINFSKFDLLIF